MAKRMLIDASHPEETRVAVVSGHRLEEFDYESSARKQLKGNIYLAKVTRVEPSLQAAFVEYGGNRHGFLPFSEIHPDYYRIPIADREALLAEEASHKHESVYEDTTEAAPAQEANGANGTEPEAGANDDETGETGDTGDTGDMTAAAANETADGEAQNENGNGGSGKVEEVAVQTSVDTIGGDDVDDAAQRRARFMRRYKIQEVIKRRQVLLVQVTKEERGNKGAALTTYLSLAGRYCVLMPNTARGGGISRKISAGADRRRLKSMIEELDIPEGVGVIVRTAGSERSKPEIRRDYEYLLRLWSEIRESTLGSTAPALIYEEANLINRAIRDLYRSDMEDILVEGDEGHKAAKAFMKSLMPSHARNVKLYKDPAIPLFQHNQVESQIDAMHSPTVQLKSGGYIVINATEALVAIDVNSGKATRERHIEETAYKTNLEAADEVARQLRLRDLAGLIVIDFIDMEESRHDRSVERRLKEAMRLDRARIQLGRISPFGLLELSRQRLRPSLAETTTSLCPTCNGTGHVRNAQSAALHIMRALEEDAIRRGGGEIAIAVPVSVGTHLLNPMRARLVDLEQRHGVTIRVDTDEDLIAPDYRLERLSRTDSAGREDAAAERRDDEKGADGDGEHRRGRGRRRGEDRGPAQRERVTPMAADEDEDTDQAAAASAAPRSSGPRDAQPRDIQPRADGSEEPSKRRRRRGKRGGRRRGRREEHAPAPEAGAGPSAHATPDAGSAARDASSQPAAESANAGHDEAHDAPVSEAPASDLPASVAGANDKSASDQPGEKRGKPRRSRGGRRRGAAKTAATEAAPSVNSGLVPGTADEPDTPAATLAKDDTPAAAERKPRQRQRRRKTAKQAVKPAAESNGDGAASKPAPEPADSGPLPASGGSTASGAPGPLPSSTTVENNAPDETGDHPRRRGWWQRWG
jgi:ribonuclease E